MSELLYLYGFVPADCAPPPADLRGVEGARVSLVPVDGFAGAVSVLDAGGYGEGRLEPRLEDLRWVGERGIEHERVVTWFADHASIVPARLLTIFSSEATLRAEAGERAAAVSRALVRFQRLREWDLKISYDREVLEPRLSRVSEEAAAIAGEIGDAGPGRRYLLERKRDEVFQREVPGTARRMARDLLDDLRDLVEEAKELEIPTHREGLPVVLDVALLVHPDRASELQERVAERSALLDELGVHAYLTGPWAPYRFMGDAEGE